MSIVSNVDLIRRVPLFSDLTVAQTSILSASVEKKRYKRGEYILRQGEVSGSLFMILSGKAWVLSQDARGREVIMANMGAGDCVGEMSLIDGEPHSASVRAETATDVLMLNRYTFLRCMRENSSLTDAVMLALVRRLRNADRQIESLALMDVYGRVYEELGQMAVLDGQGRRRLGERISRQEMAKKVGASREMVSRVMKHFEERGVVTRLEDGSHLLADRPDDID